jgi:P-loop Nucleotide Kinase1
MGPNGSGKSRWGRLLALNDPKAYTFKGESGTVIGSVFPSFGWGCVGRYQTQCGGADNLEKATIMEAIYRLCQTPLHIYLDGIMVTDVRETYWEVCLGVEKNFRRKSLIIVMDYPLQTCLDRIYARNGGKAFKEDKVALKYNNLYKNSRLWEERIAAGAPVRLHRERTEGVEEMLLSMHSIMSEVAGEEILPALNAAVAV